MSRKQSTQLDLISDNPNVMDGDGVTPLIAVIKRGDIQKVRQLLDYGADPNMKSNVGDTPLSFAVEKEHLDVVRELLDAGAYPNTKTKNDEPVIILAVRKNNLEIVNSLIISGANFNMKDKNGNTALIIASPRGFSEIVNLLIRFGANLSIENNSGDTALIMAAYHGKLEVVKLLVSAGADIDQRNKRGVNAIFASVSGNHLEILRYLHQHGGDINTVIIDGDTPLIWASEKGYADIAKFLLEEGADPNAVTEDNNSALISAIDSGSVEIISLLLRYGAQIDDFSINLARRAGIDLEDLIDFNDFIDNIINTNPKNTFGKNYLTLRPLYRRKFIDFVQKWTDYCSDPHRNLHPAYIKFIAQMLGLEVDDLEPEQICSLIRNILRDYLYQIENLDYELFKDVDPVSQEEFAEFRPIDLLQYGNPIEGKFRGLTTEYIDQSLDKTHIVDPIDRSDLMNQRSNLINGNVYQDYLFRKMLPEDMLEESRALVKPERPEEEVVESLFDRLNNAFSVPELIEFINQLNPNRRQPLPLNLSKQFYITMLMRDASRFNEIPELSELL